MRSLTKTFSVEAKLFLREPAAVFFTLLLPVLLMVLNSGANIPISGVPGASRADVLLPGYIAMVMATAGIMALPETMANYRERGILRRMRATPVSAWKVLAAHGGVQLVVTLVGIGILVAAAATVAEVSMPSSIAAVVLAVLVALASVLGTGFVLASLLPTTRTTRAVAAALYFPMIFLSGAVMPRDNLPELARRIGDAVPLTYAIRAIRTAWLGDGADWAALGILTAFTAVALAVCVRTFRWE